MTPASPSTKPNPLKLLIVAAESSSCLYARRILEELNRRGIEWQAYGIGDAAMEQLGFQRIGTAEDMAVVGLVEVFKKLGMIRQVFYNLLGRYQKEPADLVLLLDYPGFNLRLAKRLHALGARIFYYITPQVWAWKKNRVHQLKAYCEQALVIFPFEEDFLKQFGINAQFVGHPLIDEVARLNAQPDSLQRDRGRYGLAQDDQVLGLMPGSRRSELGYHLQVQIDAAELLVRKYPKMRVLLLVAPGLDMEQVRSMLPSRLKLALTLVQDDPLVMVRLCDVILVASGTATITVGLQGVPMVIMYRMNWLTAKLARWLVRTTAYFGMVNLVMNKAVVPELFQDEAHPEELAAALERYFVDPDYSAVARKELARLPEVLGKGGATQAVVDQVCKAVACSPH